MTRTLGTSFVAALLCCSLTLPARAADSRNKHEDTVEACSDHLDNDFDGAEDCDDPDCQELTICSSRGAGRAQPQPRVVQQQQPRVVYVRALTPAERRGRAMTKIIGGGLMLSFGLFAIGAGAGLYAYGFTTFSGDTGRYYGGIAGGTLFGLAGLALIGTGGAFLAIGGAELGQNPPPTTEQVPVALLPALRATF
jgi:hypothetical protein